MKKIHNVLVEVAPHVLVSLTASAIALVVFWWLMKYSILSLPDMIGTMMVIYFIVLWRMAICLERWKRRKKMKVRLYTYKVVKEDFHTGKRGKRKKSCQRPYPLKIGGLYAHLGTEFPGFWRVLELVKVEEVD